MAGEVGTAADKALSYPPAGTDESQHQLESTYQFPVFPLLALYQVKRIALDDSPGVAAPAVLPLFTPGTLPTPSFMEKAAPSFTPTLPTAAAAAEEAGGIEFNSDTSGACTTPIRPLCPAKVAAAVEPSALRIWVL